MRTIYGKKIGVTRIFNADGDSIPVTVIQAGPCPVVEVKTPDKHGYAALRVAFEPKPERLVNKPTQGVFKQAGLATHRYVREIRLEGPSEAQVGDQIKVEVFKEGERVVVTGISKGLGFQGTVRRHHFSGGPKSHGQSDRVRAPGSIGSSSYPSRVYKGQRMAGRMGNRRVTVRNIRVAKVDAANNLLCLMGAVPGKINSFLRITAKS